MKKINIYVLIIAVIISLIAGGIGGFFLGVMSTKAGSQFLENLFEQEKQAEIKNKKKLVRERFQLQYPLNWEIDVNDEDYDQDHMFSIESPGSTYVMFIIGEIKATLESTLQEQINAFSKLMSTPKVERFDTYGQYSGKGATVKGKVLGSRTTVKAFCCFVEGMTVIIIEQYPDEDFKYVRDGLSLIEKSLVLKSRKEHKDSSAEKLNR